MNLKGHITYRLRWRQKLNKDLNFCSYVVLDQQQHLTKHLRHLSPHQLKQQQNRDGRLRNAKWSLNRENETSTVANYVGRRVKVIIYSSFAFNALISHFTELH